MVGQGLVRVYDSLITQGIFLSIYVIWTERRMLKLVLNVKYLSLLSFLTAAKFYNLGHIQGIIGLL